MDPKNPTKVQAQSQRENTELRWQKCGLHAVEAAHSPGRVRALRYALTAHILPGSRAESGRAMPCDLRAVKSDQSLLSTHC